MWLAKYQFEKYQLEMGEDLFQSPIILFPDYAFSLAIMLATQLLRRTSALGVRSVHDLHEIMSQRSSDGTYSTKYGGASTVTLIPGNSN